MTTATSQRHFDYVIVGGGSGGCVLANRLSADPACTVCLIELGGDDDQMLVNAPAGVAAMLPTRINNYAFKTVPQPGLNGRRGYQPRGRVLGGSSSINAMCYIRGQAEDYDEWAAAGATGWGWNDVLPWFKQCEHNERGADEWHGTGGPLNVADLRSPNPVAQLFVEAAVERGHARNPDFNGARQEGVGLYQVTQKNGRRWNAARGWLRPVMDRPNLTVMTQTRALRLRMAAARATGVEVSQRNGPMQLIEAAQGVALCGGAFGTPQLLLLSGIGPVDELQRHGIAVQLESPGVGRDLHDHPDIVTVHRSSSRDVFSIGPLGGLAIARAIPEYRHDGTGPITSNFAEGGAFLCTHGAGGRPDVQLHFVVGIVEDHSRKLRLGPGFSCHVCVLRPQSRGSLRLASTDVRDAPLIDPGFLKEEADVRTLLAGFRLTRDILRSRALAGVRGAELHTAGIDDDQGLMHAIRQRADTLYHPVGSCRMGSDAGAVVDTQLKVRGTDNLWIADASAMPSVVSGNTNAATLMMAERAAAFMRGRQAAGAVDAKQSA